MAPRGKGLTRQAISDAALALIDREGLAGLGMERLGEALGVRGMSLYKHFANKDAILAAVFDGLLATLPAPPAEGTPEERLRSFYGGLWGLFRAHPRALPVASSQSLARPLIGACVVRGQALLLEAGYSTEQARAALLALTAYVLGFAALTAGGYPGLAAGQAGAGITPPGGGAASPPIDWAAAERDFASGLETVLAGLAARLGAGA